MFGTMRTTALPLTGINSRTSMHLPAHLSSRRALRSKSRTSKQQAHKPLRLSIATRTAFISTAPTDASSVVSTGTQSVATAPSGQPGILPGFGAPMCGWPEPLGATFDKFTGTVNFAIFSSGAVGMTLCLFSESDLPAGRVTYEVPLDPLLNKTGDVWHVMLPDLDTRLLYGYRVFGTHQDKHEGSTGHRYDETAIIVDPYAKGVVSRRGYGQLAQALPMETPEATDLTRTWPPAAGIIPSAEDEDFDWQGDQGPLGIPMQDLVIYEMHVRGFTQDPSSGVVAPGTYAGLVEKLDYVRSLGVNAIELLPSQEFNELEYYSQIPGSDPPAYRYNFWGYSTVNFFSPMSRYSFAVASGRPGRDMMKEFKTMVRECHKRGIEVILDVVFNHTAEGNHMGPTLSFRGLDNRVYYMLATGGEYYNYSGCGNTFNCNQPVVRAFILDCLRYWVEEFHVDGFRFDLASILTRANSAWHPQEPPMEGEFTAPLSKGAVVDESGYMTDGAGQPTGTPLSDPPLIEMISEDPVLKRVKLIAEAWDCDGLNQVGAFPHYGGRWAEWNGQFRDTVRNFIKGMDGWAGNFASAICGSPDLYCSTTPGEADWWGNNAGRKWKGGRTPSHSINFVTAHDGFTLADLVAFNEKHNEANGEGNNDGEKHNNSWNCGEEGPTPNMTVNRLRQRQMRNLAAALMVSHGVPMLHMGDEYAHTKNGNNNTYCHDSHLNWFNWDQARYDATGFQRFMRLLIRFRLEHPELRRLQFVGDQDIQWHGELPNQPDWTETSRLVAFTLRDGQGGGIFVAFNTSHNAKTLTLPKWPGRVWQPIADTSKVAPFDFLVPDEALSPADVGAALGAMNMWLADSMYPLLPWSCIIMESVPEACAQDLRIPSATTTFIKGLQVKASELQKINDGRA